ncbi:MAG: Two-component transcriptional response regulator, LuxR family [uncultured Friedmanniella sp.]|uniref:Two-component transcriptional response regulator, LuxR family n=1 Tax=uncultured Friedmanniella sp. TaxID=335381 RepID=A0A6J4K1V4_9ACTN|nr:MAG: Two-component transcriptional response regulator, LuxR family [uncultured Friedmanniella sp.]
MRTLSATDHPLRAALPGAPACHAVTVRVLLVDDEERMVTALRRGLTAEGFAVQCAATGPDGLRQARSGDFDAVVLDVMLPGMSGYEVVRRLRAEDNWVPVLMLSAKDGEYDQADALDDGADDYLTKPFSFVILLARLRALLRRGVVARPAVLTSGDLMLDPATREVRAGAAPVELTPREFVLLEYLMRQGGRVVAKGELLEHVWDSAAEVAPNAVEVYVGYLRRKIGAGRLVTVRGVGYRLVA